MKEDFLHYLWRQGLFLNKDLKTTEGNKVTILQNGEHNTNSGPDFLNAKVKIGETLWAGNVEIHLKASDWIKHNHHKNPAYDNVILHIVTNADAEIKRKNNEKIPTVKIDIPPEMYERYNALMAKNNWVACESFIKNIDDFTVLQWKEALLIERLAEKTELINERFAKNKKNLEETFYQTLAYNFGFKINSLPFEMLAKSIPSVYLAKHKDSPQLLEALLFGQANLIPKTCEQEYVLQLKKDYRHLQAKFSLKPLNDGLWKFMRMRPNNFPTIRIAQFARLIHKSSALLSKILEIQNVSDIYNFFDFSTSKYWQTHYTFSRESDKKDKNFGKSATNNIIINSIAPFLFFYGKYHKKQEYTERAIDFLQKISAEKNQITKHWQKLGLKTDNAFDTQALIQLKNKYCNQQKCLNCRIGNQVIQHKF